MVKWKNILITKDTSILQTIKVIDKEGLRAALVIDEGERLLGMVTDGDIRRSILNNINLNEPIEKIMNRKPTVASAKDTREQILTMLQKLSIYHMPIVDDNYRIIGLETLDKLLSVAFKNNLVVVMAGGLGKRLYPLTEDCPKPMLKIGNKPVLQVLLENFIKSGFRKFCIAVNYKADMIKDYFADGSHFGVHIDYLQESKRLGTAGALGLLHEKPDEALFVTNADVITNIDFQCLLDFHQESKVAATLCIREHEQVIPYGVVHRDERTHHLIDIIEKPVRQFFVNAGIYLLEPFVLDMLKPNTYYDMPDFLRDCVKKQYKVAAFPLREYWLDVGRHEDLQKAHNDYEEFFANAK